MKEVTMSTSDHSLTKPLSEFTIEELESQLSVYEAQLYNLQVQLDKDARGVVNKMLMQLGKSAQGLGLEYATSMYWLHEKLNLRVMTVYSNKNLANVLDIPQVKFECFGNIETEGSTQFCYTVRAPHASVLAHVEERLMALEDHEITVKFKGEQNQPFLNILDVRAVQTLAEATKLTYSTLELLNDWIEIFASVNTSVYQMDLGIKQANELLRDKRAEREAQKILDNKSLQEVANQTTEKVASVDDLKKMASNLRLEAENRGLDITSIKRGKAKKTLMREIEELQTVLA